MDSYQGQNTLFSQQIKQVTNHREQVRSFLLCTVFLQGKELLEVPKPSWTAWGWQGIFGTWMLTDSRSSYLFQTMRNMFITLFGVGVFQYLVKPVDEQKFAEVFSRAVVQILSRTE